MHLQRFRATKATGNKDPKTNGPLLIHTNLSKRRAGVLQKHLEVGIEPSSSLGGRLESSLATAVSVVAGSRSVRSTVRLFCVRSASRIEKGDV